MESQTKRMKKTKKNKSKRKVQVSSTNEIENDIDDDGDETNEPVESGKSVIKEALKEDAATAMGDAIRWVDTYHIFLKQKMIIGKVIWFAVDTIK